MSASHTNGARGTVIYDNTPTATPLSSEGVS
jgi:hypothetical protein